MPLLNFPTSRRQQRPTLALSSIHTHPTEALCKHFVSQRDSKKTPDFPEYWGPLTENPDAANDEGTQLIGASALVPTPLPPPPLPRHGELQGEPWAEDRQTRTPQWMPAEVQELLPKICAEHRVPQSGQGLDDQSDGFSCDNDAILLLGESLNDLESVSNDSDLDDLDYCSPSRAHSALGDSSKSPVVIIYSDHKDYHLLDYDL